MIREPSAERQPPEPQRRVPDCDIVDVGRRPIPKAEAEPLDLCVVALPVWRQPRPDQSERASDRRSLTRPLTALLVLGLGVLGAMYVGKRYADTHVIIVPAPTNERSVIT